MLTAVAFRVNNFTAMFASGPLNTKSDLQCVACPSAWSSKLLADHSTPFWECGLQGGFAPALPALEELHVGTPADVRCQLSALPRSLRQLSMTGLCVLLEGGGCTIAPDLAVNVYAITASLNVDDPWCLSRGAELQLTVRELQLSVRKLDAGLQSSWPNRHPGEQPSAAAVLLDFVKRQPFTKLALWQKREDKHPLWLECIEGNDDDHPLCSEPFDSLQQLHAACRGLARQVGVSCKLTTSSGLEPAFILSLSANV